MPARKGLISYDGLPISSGGGHGLGRLHPAEAWDAVRRFLQTCTTAKVPERISIDIHDFHDEDAAQSARLLAAAVARFYLSSREHRRQDYSGKGSTRSWDLPPTLGDQALEWLSAESLSPGWLGGPAHVNLDFQFRLKSTAGEELPFQASGDYLDYVYSGYGIVFGESVARLRFSARSTLSLVLFLPFEAPDEYLANYAAFLQANLPIKLSRHHWKHWTLTKKGNSYVGRRMPPPI
jgi:hypothetical protein